MAGSSSLSLHRAQPENTHTHFHQHINQTRYFDLLTAEQTELRGNSEQEPWILASIKHLAVSINKNYWPETKNYCHKNINDTSIKLDTSKSLWLCRKTQNHWQEENIYFSIIWKADRLKFVWFPYSPPGCCQRLWPVTSSPSSSCWCEETLQETDIRLILVEYRTTFITKNASSANTGHKKGPMSKVKTSLQWFPKVSLFPRHCVVDLTLNE